MIKRFTMPEYLAAAAKLSPNLPHFQVDSSYAHGWTAGIGTKRAIHLATVGDTTMVKATQEMIDRFEINTAVDRVFKSQPGFVGAVNVGAYLSGSPTCMRARQRVDSVARHINVYVNVSTSGGVTVQTGLRRGAAIIGLLDALQKAGLGLTIHIISEFDTYREMTKGDGDQYHLITLETPVDLSVATFALAHPAFDRCVTMPMADTIGGFPGGWPRSHNKLGGSYSPAYREFLSKTLEMGPRDIYIPAAYSSDELTKNPEEWVRQTITQVLT